MSKTQAKDNIEKMVYDLALRTKKGISFELVIPHVGILMVKKKVIAVAFDDNLLYPAKYATNKNRRTIEEFSVTHKRPTEWNSS